MKVLNYSKLENLKNFVNPKMFGAVGNGIADDTKAFKYAIENAELNGLSIFIPEGKYLITDRLIISRSMTFKGASHDNTIIIFKGSYHNETPYDDLYYEESNAAICLKAYNCTLEDFTLIGVNESYYGEPNKENRSSCNGIIMHYPRTLENGNKVYTGCERVRLSNIDIKYFKSGLFFYGGWNRYIERVQSIDCDYGVKYYPLELETVGEWTASGDVWIACSMIGNVIAGFYGKAIFQTCIWNSVFEYNNRAIYIDNCPDIVFKNCWNEANENKLFVKGSAKFEGGYNINNGTVEHEIIGGKETVQFDGSSSSLSCRKGDIVFEQISGVIVKGVDIGAEVDNLISNPTFSEASGGTGIVSSFLGWEVYPAYVGSINEDTNPYHAQISVGGREDKDLFFGIRTNVPVEYGTNYTISFEALTPDREVIDQNAYIFVAWKNSDGAVISHDNRTFEFVGNNAWEEKEINITPIEGATSCQIGFGLGRNGTIKIKNPLFTYSDSATRNNVYIRRDSEDMDNVKFLDISGNLIATYNKNNVLTKDDIPTIVDEVIKAMSN